jgi:hypothetical protein
MVVQFVVTDDHKTIVTMPMLRWKAFAYLPLPAGTMVTAIGRITEIDNWGIELASSELISVEDA